MESSPEDLLGIKAQVSLHRRFLPLLQSKSNRRKGLCRAEEAFSTLLETFCLARDVGGDIHNTW